MFQNSAGRRKWLMIGILVVFVLFRLPALQLIYHQDEYKWARIVDSAYGLQGSVPHPPLVETAYHLWGSVTGYGSLRVLSLLVSIVNLLLVFMLARRWYGERSAIAAGVVLSLMTASVLASTQVDIDGAFLPLWTLVAFHAATDIWEGRRRWGWVLLAFSCIGGFLTKVSFILVPVALAAEAYARRRGRRISRIGLGLCTVGALACVALWMSPVLDGIGFVRYAKSFGILNFFQRDYFEVALLTTKTIVLLGPIVLFAGAGFLKDVHRYRILGFFLLAQALFNFVLADFSHRTLERYLLSFVIPVAMIAGDVLVSAFTHLRFSRKGMLAIGVSLVFFSALLFLPKAVIPLNPKTEFVQRLVSGRLSFLIPISGGSGPIGFFVPADVTLGVFLFVLLAVAYAKWRPAKSGLFVLASSVLICAYSLLTTLEFDTGILYGNASALAEKAIEYIQQDPGITRVITYNDIGGWELGESKKYYKRFYSNPEFLATNEKKFASFDGHYLVVNMPPIASNNPASLYFRKCGRVYHDTSKQISADIYDCRGVLYP